ncbi:MAG TPA: hypothetical protein ENJ82_17880, partial [Bacteroidetes bacterium]|nr:hypothetical protein [Bacteroidota bacterium]
MNLSTRHILWTGIFFLSFHSLIFGQIQPCYGNGQAGRTVCPSDGPAIPFGPVTNCTTCVYNWPGGVTTPTASIVIPRDTYPNYFVSNLVSMSYSDTSGTFCTGTALNAWEVGTWGTTQLSRPVLLNGPYTGDTTITWIYTRYHANQGILSTWDYSRTYSANGGTILASSVDLLGGGIGIYYDTLWIKWNNTATREINSAGALYGTNNNGWGWFMGGCNGYSEDIAPESLNAAYPIGLNTVCPNDTVTYYTTSVVGAVYTWTVSGGMILSGQGTSQIQVVWSTVPGNVTITRNVNSNISSNSMAVQLTQATVSPLPADTSFCLGSSLTLDAGIASSWLWSTTDTSRMITVTDSGDYIVTRFFCGGASAVSDSIRVNRITAIQPNLGPDYTFCMGTPQTFNPGTGFNTYSWLGGVSTGPTYNVSGGFAGGPIWVSTIDTNGCAAQDTVVLTAQAPPTVNLGQNRLICAGDSVLLDAGNPGGTYVWSTGDTVQSFYHHTGGSVSVNVTVNGCTRSDTVQITVNPGPLVNLGSVSSFCQGDSILLNAGNPGATYL